MYLSRVKQMLNDNQLSYISHYEYIDSLSRETIRRETTDVAGIYVWENKLNNKSYVGKAKSIYQRLLAYFRRGELNRAAKLSNSKIAKAILKYDISNFRLFIVEIFPVYDPYSEADRILLGHQEGYWAGILKPYYNTLEISSSGNLSNQSEESRAKSRAYWYERGKTQ